MLSNSQVATALAVFMWLYASAASAGVIIIEGMTSKGQGISMTIPQPHGSEHSMELGTQEPTTPSTEDKVARELYIWASMVFGSHEAAAAYVADACAADAEKHDQDAYDDEYHHGYDVGSTLLVNDDDMMPVGCAAAQLPAWALTLLGMGLLRRRRQK